VPTTTQRLTPPRAAAFAGVIFSVLMATTLVIIRLSVPDPETGPGYWLSNPSRLNAVRFAIQLAPFAGIAFLWFIGVLRTQFGELEDRFFATVFLGSGLLFVASLFASAALAGALLEAMSQGHSNLLNADIYYLARRLVGTFLNVFGIKMAGVFVISTSTIVIRTGILPRWVAFSGYACAGVLLLIITNWQWIALLFPAWMLVVSARILLGEFYLTGRHAAGPPQER
jgi:hypothetical protein